MSCCCPHSRSAGKLFTFFARRYRKRFQKKGFEPSQKQLMEGIVNAGYAGSSILEVGSGVGHFHQTLLENGAQSAVGVDLASGMIEEAGRWAQERGLAERTQYIQGDFVEGLDQDTGVADITILDKVICCYPDAKALISKSLEKTGRVYAVTYPRKRWVTRAGEKLGIVVMRMIRSCFHPYVHDPEQIESWITARGFEKVYQDTTYIWLTQVYVRQPAG
ncbi:MAG: class I SAM-dependent methyltransferase [Gammaproteobacteria bacterium]|nr:class I SAM-dependent methyltransferase [Gammaproteobacteria bacterium]